MNPCPRCGGELFTDDDGERLCWDCTAFRPAAYPPGPDEDPAMARELARWRAECALDDLDGLVWLVEDPNRPLLY
jgi:hypothetical protein